MAGAGCPVHGAVAPAPAPPPRQPPAIDSLTGPQPAAHSDTAQMPLCFIIYLTWRPGCPYLRRRRVRRLAGYHPGRLGHFLKLLKHPSHDLLVCGVVAAGSGLCSREGKAASISWYTDLSKPQPLLSRTLLSSTPMLSPRRVIESHPRPSLSVAMMRCLFPMGTCHKPTRQKQSQKSRQWETIQ